MGKKIWKPGNMLYPLPVVLVSVSDGKGKDNIFTVAWTGTVCTSPPMVSISVRPERYSYSMIRDTGEFVINLTTESMAEAVDYCGVKSGRDVDKFQKTGLTRQKGKFVQAPLVEESPVSMECRVKEVVELGSHHLFLAEILCVHVEESYLDTKGKFHLGKARPLVYCHGEYAGLGKILGTFGFSVKKGRKELKIAGSRKV